MSADFYTFSTFKATPSTTTTTTTTKSTTTTRAPLCKNGAPDSAYPYCCLNGENNPECKPVVQDPSVDSFLLARKAFLLELLAELRLLEDQMTAMEGDAVSPADASHAWSGGCAHHATATMDVLPVNSKVLTINIFVIWSIFRQLQ